MLIQFVVSLLWIPCKPGATDVTAELAPLGCFLDFVNGVRDLPVRVADLNFNNGNKAVECANSCRALNYRYSGLQYAFQVSCRAVMYVCLQERAQSDDTDCMTGLKPHCLLHNDTCNDNERAGMRCTDPCTEPAGAFLCASAFIWYMCM
jgi:hypothetical protein